MFGWTTFPNSVISYNFTSRQNFLQLVKADIFRPVIKIIFDLKLFFKKMRLPCGLIETISSQSMRKFFCLISNQSLIYK